MFIVSRGCLCRKGRSRVELKLMWSGFSKINIHNHNTFRHSTAGLTFSPFSQFDQNVSLHQQMVTVAALASRLCSNKSPRREMEGMKRAGHIFGAKHLCKHHLKGPRMWELRPPVALLTLRWSVCGGWRLPSKILSSKSSSLTSAHKQALPDRDRNTQRKILMENTAPEGTALYMFTVWSIEWKAFSQRCHPFSQHPLIWGINQSLEQHTAGWTSTDVVDELMTFFSFFSNFKQQKKKKIWLTFIDWQIRKYNNKAKNTKININSKRKRVGPRCWLVTARVSVRARGKRAGQRLPNVSWTIQKYYSSLL